MKTIVTFYWSYKLSYANKSISKCYLFLINRTLLSFMNIINNIEKGWKRRRQEICYCMEGQCTGPVSKKSWDWNNPSLKLSMRNWNMKRSLHSGLCYWLLKISLLNWVCCRYFNSTTLFSFLTTIYSTSPVSQLFCKAKFQQHQKLCAQIRVTVFYLVLHIMST